MSVVGLTSSSSEMFKKSSLHRKNDSGELDVFEAAKYFSGHANEIYDYSNQNNSYSSIRKDNDHYLEKRRLSLDVPMIRNTTVLVMDHQKKIKQTTTTKEKKHKQQPSSPGGRLASFLNSIFNQKSIISSSRKKKSSIKDDHDDDQIISPAGGWRRKRRSSISHFRSSTTTTTTTTTMAADAKSLYSSSSSAGFRTPPPYAAAPTPNKSYKGLNHVVMANLISSKPTTGLNIVHDSDDQSDYLWLDDESSTYYKQMHKNNINAIVPDKIRSIHSNWPMSEEKEFKKFINGDDDDGADSDSSSDLFELPNYDLGCFSSDLPVYETTNMDNIKRSTTISTAATR